MRLFAYDAAGGGGVASPTYPGAGEEGSDAAPAMRDDTFFLPSDFPGKDDYKPGDTITLKVVGGDKEGQLEVECVHPEGKGGDGQDWKTDLRQSVPETPG